jgi:hypothetical protein
VGEAFDDAGEFVLGGGVRLSKRHSHLGLYSRGISN